MEEIKQNYILKKCLQPNGRKERKEYVIEFKTFENKINFGQEEIQKNPLSRQIIKKIIKDILFSNPKLKLCKDVFIMTNKKKIIETNNYSIPFFQGFNISLIETDNGNYLNATLKNKIIKSVTVNDYINIFKNKKNKDIQKEIKENLIGHYFQGYYFKRNYQIYDIIFDKTPKNTNINYKGKTINLVEYYNMAHHLIIKDQNQPLVLVKKRDNQGQPINIYFIPEFCLISGDEDNIMKDELFMKEFEKLREFDPIDSSTISNEFLNLFLEKERGYLDKMSSKEKCELYGIEVQEVIRHFYAYYMEEKRLNNEEYIKVQINDIAFPFIKKKDIINWVCFYEKNNYTVNIPLEYFNFS